MKALIIDNEELFRLGVRSLLEARHQFDEIIEVTSDRELLSLSVADTQKVRLTIMNPLCFPDLPDSFWRPVQQICPSSKIIAMGDSNYEQFSYHGIKFVPRGISAHKIAALINTTIAEITNINAPIEIKDTPVSKPVQAIGEAAAADVKNFSKRRLQILEMAALGLSNKDIAVKLDIAEGTVKAHMHLIMKMLNVTNRTQAALWYQNHIQ